MKPRLLIKLCCIIVLLTMAMRVRAQTPPPILADFKRFEATFSTGQILVAWETETELDNAGFLVTRSTNPDGPYDTVSDFIPAEGSGVIGAAYEFVDTDIVEGSTYYYILEAIHTDSQVEAIGPISVKAEYEKIYLPLQTKNFDSSGGLVVEAVNGYYSRYDFFM